MELEEPYYIQFGNIDPKSRFQITTGADKYYNGQKSNFLSQKYLFSYLCQFLYIKLSIINNYNSSPLRDPFLAPVEGCSFRLHQSGPLGPTNGPADRGPFRRNFCRAEQGSIRCRMFPREHRVSNKRAFGIEQGSIQCRTREHTVPNKGEYSAKQRSIRCRTREHTEPYVP